MQVCLQRPERLSGGVPLRAISQTLVERLGAVSSSHQIIASRILFPPSKHSGVGWQAPPDTRPSPLGSSFTRRRFNRFFCDGSGSDFFFFRRGAVVFRKKRVSVDSTKTRFDWKNPCLTAAVARLEPQPYT